MAPSAIRQFASPTLLKPATPSASRFFQDAEAEAGGAAGAESRCNWAQPPRAARTNAAGRIRRALFFTAPLRGVGKFSRNCTRGCLKSASPASDESFADSGVKPRFPRPRMDTANVRAPLEL